MFSIYTYIYTYILYVRLRNNNTLRVYSDSLITMLFMMLYMCIYICIYTRILVWPMHSFTAAYVFLGGQPRGGGGHVVQTPARHSNPNLFYVCFDHAPECMLNIYVIFEHAATRMYASFHIFVFDHACVHAFLRSCVPACLRACVPACLRACMHACAPMCPHVGLPACMCARVHACMRVCLHP